jgi:hypothetical protein
MKKVISLQNLSKITGLPKSTLRVDLPESVKAKFEMLPDKNSGVKI